MHWWQPRQTGVATWTRELYCPPYSQASKPCPCVQAELSRVVNRTREQCRWNKDHGNATWWQAPSGVTALPDTRLKTLVGAVAPSTARPAAKAGVSAGRRLLQSTPAAVDWTTKFTQVARDQGNCGSCW